LVGRNSRLDPIQTIFLSHGLNRLNEAVDKRNSNALFFRDVVPFDVHRFISNSSHIINAYHQYVCIFDSINQANTFEKFMNDNNIETGRHYPYTIDSLGFFTDSKKLNPVSNNLALKIVSIPISETLLIEELDRVRSALYTFFK
jgi:dTDP-4-amino-4,6-dideoxygalactose transaminase